MTTATHPSPARTARDTRLDVLRGLAIVSVVVNHIDQKSLWHLVTVERVGLVTGAEVFVMLSGVVLGMVHRRRTARDGWAPSARSLLRRSLLLYVTSVLVVLAVFLLRFVPGLDDSALATYTDRDTGQVYDLYPQADQPVRFVRGLLLLVYGPGQFNIMGLYVVLLALAPAVLWLLVKRWWLLLLLLSGTGLALVHLGVDRLLPSQFENSFLLLAWQFLFFVGMLVGFHRDEIEARLAGRTRQAVVATAVLLSVGFVALAWSNPPVFAPEMRLPVISVDQYWETYAAAFDRRSLGLGRLVNLVALCVAAYALLGRFGTVLNRLGTRSLVSLGQATLYIFVVHLSLVLLVDNLADGGYVGLYRGTVVHAVALLVLVVMVRRRVLFSVIPR